MVRRTRAGRSHPRCRWSRSPIACRTCGTVSAGVLFFPPPGPLGQEPRGDQGQGLVVVPPRPRPHLVVGQPGLTLGPLDGLLAPVLGLEHPGELRRRGVERGVRQQVVVLPRPAPLPLAEYHQPLRDLRRPVVGPGLDQRPGGLPHQWSLLGVADLDLLPRPRRYGGGPPVGPPDRRGPAAGGRGPGTAGRGGPGPPPPGPRGGPPAAHPPPPAHLWGGRPTAPPPPPPPTPPPGRPPPP